MKNFQSSFDLTMSAVQWRQLQAHLFSGDGDEHGAVLAAGLSESKRGSRLLVRDVFLATDGIDYVAGQRGYRMLTAKFVRDCALYCRDEKLAYLAVHNHSGLDHVEFSADDMASHQRGYPALLDIVGGTPVGALVFAKNSVAGDIWSPDGTRATIRAARIVGPTIREFYPTKHARQIPTPGFYDRQARLFGDSGQAILHTLKVGIIGAGGVGSLLGEYMARLGVGQIIVADPQRIEISNLSRVVGSTRRDAMSLLTSEERPGWLQKIGRDRAASKVSIAKRVGLAANPDLQIEGVVGDFVDDPVARKFIDCDYLFLAADSMQSRLVFNAIVHQYLIPGVQVGAKVQVDKQTGNIVTVYSVARPVTPDAGCLWCNGLIPPARLQEEATTESETNAQRYVEESEIRAPSVITLNAVASGYAANDFLFKVTGLRSDSAPDDYVYFEPQKGNIRFDAPRRESNCTECGNTSRSRRARGDQMRLPTRS
jgi:ThiF family